MWWLQNLYQNAKVFLDLLLKCCFNLWAARIWNQGKQPPTSNALLEIKAHHVLLPTSPIFCRLKILQFLWIKLKLKNNNNLKVMQGTYNFLDHWTLISQLPTGFLLYWTINKKAWDSMFLFSWKKKLLQELQTLISCLILKPRVTCGTNKLVLPMIRPKLCASYLFEALCNEKATKMW